MKLEHKEHIIKKNDYVRTINGQIDRIKRIQEGEDYKGSFLEIEHYSGILDLYRCPMINIYPVKYKNNSKNIIDLIEVGDVVYVKDVEYNETYKSEICENYKNKLCIIDFECNGIRLLKESIEDNKIKLLAIVTREQFEQNCYKLKEMLEQ